jgi:chromosomal replication initiation ATPase DnaA|tara:strand:- start:179 stop:832 length:654 start_codon:yes stop_codon:yes gene_type:complete
MSQLTFKFPFKTSYFEKDFFVSENNFPAYRLVETWPDWPGKNINIYGPSGCGKTHLANILKKKINSLFINAADFSEENIIFLKDKECLIIDNYKSNIDEELLYSTINLINQSNQCVIINSSNSLKKINVKLQDLKSRFDGFTDIGINLPTDDLLRVIITKFFSDKQIQIDIKLLEYILQNIDRSYEKVLMFIKDIDIASLSSGKSININLIKNVLKK